MLFNSYYTLHQTFYKNADRTFTFQQQPTSR